MPIKITIPRTELYDEKAKEFIYVKEQTISMEHSLVSLHKWEQKWHIPFLSTKDKTYEQVLDYLKFMTLTQNVDELAYKVIPQSEMNKINKYIENPMTATTITDFERKKKNKEIITAEIIYYWMIKLGIPVEFQKWHLNSLLMLIEVIGIKEAPEKQMSQAEIIRRQRAINAANRAKFHSKG